MMISFFFLSYVRFTSHLKLQQRCVCDRCQVRISGDMMLSFPAGLVQLINAQPNHNIPPISFRIRNYQNLENVVPNKQVLNM